MKSKPNRARRQVATGAALLLSATMLTACQYKTCAELNEAFPHGVGRRGAVDQTSSTPVRNFTVDDAAYYDNNGANPGSHDLDRDNDGIACEKA